jgi:hypothetical protein
MTLSKTDRNILCLIVILLSINYMVVTILFHDNIFLKFLRDILVLILFLKVLKNKDIFSSKILMTFFIFIGVLIFAGVRTEDKIVASIVIRRYIFPIICLAIFTNINFGEDRVKILRFVIKFISVLSIFGIIQAIILGDEFLRNLGYPLEYSYAYGKMMLYTSYYFGGLGIQRVVATFSSSNICGLILGTTLLLGLIYKEYIFKTKKGGFFLWIIFIGYILTFSRSNFLAFIFSIFKVKKYISNKKNIIVKLLLIGVCVVVFGVIQGTSGILYKLIGWVESSLNFTESSAAGRSSIWALAFNEVLHKPFGIGLGHVGVINNEKGLNFWAENSYLTIALDTGWLGLLLYMIGLLRIIKYFKINSLKYLSLKDEQGLKLCKAGETLTLYMMIVMFFSNHIQDMEAIVIIYLYIGLGLSYIKYNKLE